MKLILINSHLIAVVSFRFRLDAVLIILTVFCNKYLLYYVKYYLKMYSNPFKSE